MQRNYDNEDSPLFPLFLQHQKHPALQTHSPNLETFPPPLSPKPQMRKSSKTESTTLRKSKSEYEGTTPKNFGHWSSQQNKRYHWFLQIHHGHFLHRQMRRLDRIFKSMASFVGMREAEQCRSHHQKMEKKYHHSIGLILLNLRKQHYQTEHHAPLEEDIRLNHIPITDGILTAEFLNEEVARFCREKEEQSRKSQIWTALCAEVSQQDKQEEEKIQREGGKRQEEMEVDLLLDDYAPHILFE